MLNVGSPLEIPAGLVSIYVVRSGEALLARGDAGETLTLKAGSFVTLTHGCPHRLGVPVPVSDPATAVVTHGHLSLATLGRNPFRHVLPGLIRLSRSESSTLRRIEPLVQLVSDEQAIARPGWQVAVGNLLHALFVETVRTYLTDHGGAASAPGWVQAALDGSLAPVLALIHQEPQKAWTVTALAKHARMSRSAFSNHFAALLGKSPLQYLTEYRMQRACGLLRSTNLEMNEIAKLVGYESASSFCGVFKRWIGTPPAQFRRIHAASTL